MKQDLLDLLERYKNEKGEAILYSFLNSRGKIISSLTFKELYNHIAAFGTQLISQVKEGKRVLLLFPTSPKFLIAFFGCLYAGVIPVPLSLPTKQNGIENVVKIASDCTATLVITEEDFNREYQKSLISNFPVRVCNFKNFFDKPWEKLPRRRNVRDIAFLQYTSGSTSHPKGVIISHQNIMVNQAMITQKFGHTEDSVVLGWTPLHHDMGLVGNVMQPMYIGCPCYLMSPRTFIQRPLVWLQALSNFKITTTGGPNFCFQLCVKRVSKEKVADLDLGNLRVMYNGAEPISFNVINDFCDLLKETGFKRKVFSPCYGLAEATLLVSGINYNEDIRYTIVSASDLSRHVISEPANDQDKHLLVSCGNTLNGIHCTIRDPLHMSVKDIHNIGEVVISGDAVMQGYWNKDNDYWVGDANEPNMVGVPTGDLGFFDEAGDLYITGRLKDLMIHEGRNIYPQDVEETIHHIQTKIVLALSAVFSIKSTEDDNGIVAVIEIDRTSLRHITLANLAEAKNSVLRKVSAIHGFRLIDVVFLPPNTIPKTTSGKIQRQKTKNLYKNEQLCLLEVMEKMYE